MQLAPLQDPGRNATAAVLQMSSRLLVSLGLMLQRAILDSRHRYASKAHQMLRQASAGFLLSSFQANVVKEHL